MKKLYILVFLSLFVTNTANALTVSPLPKAEMIAGVVTVSLSDDNSDWRADLYSVSIEHNKEVLTPATDVVVAPRIFKAPGQVRIATKTTPEGDKELFYRLVLTQQVPVGATGIVRRISVSLPVVQEPVNQVVASVCKDKDSVIRNTGNVFIKAVVNSRPMYVLPGTERIIPRDAVSESGVPLCAN